MRTIVTDRQTDRQTDRRTRTLRNRQTPGYRRILPNLPKNLQIQRIKRSDREPK